MTLSGLRLTGALTFHNLLAVTETVPCRDRANDPNWWFGDSEDPDEKYNNREAQRAVALCQECPLKLECLSHALAANELYGVWGATTAAQRDALRRQGRRN